MLLTNAGHVMTLANSIIGVGILAMPFCFYKCGIVLSILLLVLNYLVTRISCYYLIKSALLARRRSFEFLGFYAFGSSGKLMVELCIIGYLIGTCIAYFVVVGDLGPRIIAKILDLDENDNLRTWVMVIVTILCIIPLGLLKNVDSLSAVSAASIGFYICLVLKVMSESEALLMSNDWYDKVVYWEPDGILQCLPIFSMACSCQMQLFEVMESVPNHTLEKMNSIVKQSTKICTSVYVMVGLFGYIGFCTIPFTGNILIHFSPTISSEVIKTGFVLSIAFSFPLVIFPCRVSIYSLIYKRGHGDASTYIPERRFKIITISIVLISLVVALMIPSIELVIGLVGSTIGVAICVMFPASVYLKIFSKIRTFERTLAQTVLIGGFCLMILGTYANLNAIDEKRSGISIEPTQLNNMAQNDFNVPETIVNKIAKKDMELNVVPSLPNPVLSSLEPVKSKLIDSKLPIENNEIKKIVPKLPIEKLEYTEKIIKPFKENSKLPVEDTKPLVQILKLPTESKNLPITNQTLINQNTLNEKKTVPKVYNKVESEIKEPSKPKIIKQDNIKEIPLDTKSINVTTNSNNVIDKDAIKKDEEIAAEEESKNSDKKLEIAEAELKRTKEMLEKKVDELKQEIVKQNEETQKLVNEKLSDIIEKVNEIKEEVKEEKKIEQSKIDENIEQQKQHEIIEKIPEINTNLKFNAAKGSLVEHLSKKIQEAQKLSVNKDNLSNTDKIIDVKTNNVIKPEPLINVQNNNNNNTPPIQINESNLKDEFKKSNVQNSKEKVYEPLSYKTGEFLNKINETNFNDKRAALPLPLLMNSTNINKIIANNNNNSNVPSINNNQSQNLIKNPKIETLNNLNASDKIPVETKPNKHTESNIEAIRRDILEIKDENENEKKLAREKRDLDNFEFNLANLNNIDNNENCLPNCLIKNDEPLKNINLIVEELNSGLKMMTGGRDLKYIKDNSNDEEHSK